jgi:hypothetical protein
MALQHINIEKSIPLPLNLEEQAAKLVSEQEEVSAPTVINEREEFVKHIEAYCDCV